MPTTNAATDEPAAGLLTPLEARVYLLYHRTPGLNNRQIAEKIGLHPGHVSRVRTAAETKVDELKRLCELANGDPAVVEQYLFEVECGGADGVGGARPG